MEDSFCFQFGMILVSPFHIYDKYLEQFLDLLAITFWHKRFYYSSFTLLIIYIWDASEIVKQVDSKQLPLVTIDVWKSRSFPSHTTKTKEGKI